MVHNGRYSPFAGIHCKLQTMGQNSPGIPGKDAASDQKPLFCCYNEGILSL